MKNKDRHEEKDWKPVPRKDGQNRKQILETAEQYINGPRAHDYGSARDNFTRIGAMWSNILQMEKLITPEQVALMMVAIKISRLAENPDHLDSWIDIAGYAALGGEIATTDTDL